MKNNKKICFLFVTCLILFSAVCNYQFSDLTKTIPYLVEIISFGRRHNNSFISFPLPQNIAIDGSPITTSTNGNYSPTLSITIGGNSNRLLLVGVSYYHGAASPTVSSVTLGAQSFTLAKRQNTANTATSELWQLVAPNTGAGTVTVNVPASGTAIIAFGAISIYNVNQSSPIGVTSGTTGSGNPNLTITPTTTGSIIIDNLYENGGGGPSGAPTASLTQAWSFIESTSNFTSSSQYNLTPTISSSNALNWTANQSTPVWNQVAVEILKA